jgi:dinuclear metal center YbgI/SA1388 family protein
MPQMACPLTSMPINNCQIAAEERPLPMNNSILTDTQWDAVWGQIAPATLAASYDNVGWLIKTKKSFSKALVVLEITAEVLEEAMAKQCDLIVCHHPLIFKAVKQIHFSDPIGGLIVRAIQNQISIFCAHTNLDHVWSEGVNQKLAQKLGLDLQSCAILQPKSGDLRKCVVYVPTDYRDRVVQAMFDAGGGHIGAYAECSFRTQGTGTFLPGADAQPFSGQKDVRSEESEEKLEVLVPIWRVESVLHAARQVHPYETMAYECLVLDNVHQEVGSGAVGLLPKPMSLQAFLTQVKEALEIPMLRWSGPEELMVEKVALCGGSGAFLIPAAQKSGAQVFLSADIKYHDFFLTRPNFALVDTGHFENEQFTTEIFFEVIRKKFPNFAVLNSEVRTNPVKYY